MKNKRKLYCTNGFLRINDLLINLNSLDCIEKYSYEVRENSDEKKVGVIYWGVDFNFKNEHTMSEDFETEKEADEFFKQIMDHIFMANT